MSSNTGPDAAYVMPFENASEDESSDPVIGLIANKDTTYVVRICIALGHKLAAVVSSSEQDRKYLSKWCP